MKKIMIIAFCFVCFSSYGQITDSSFKIGDYCGVYNLTLSDLRISITDSLGEVLYMDKDSGMVVIDSLRAIKVLLKLLMQSQNTLSSQYKQQQDNLFDKPKTLNLLYTPKQ